MKVLQLLCSNGFYGAERVTRNLCMGLQSLEADLVIVIGPGLEKEFAKLHNRSTYVLPFSEGSFFQRIKSYVRAEAQLRMIMRSEKPDIVHVHLSLSRLMVLAIRPNCAVVETIHGLDYLHLKAHAMERIFQRVGDLLAAITFDGHVFYMREAMKKFSSLRRIRPTRVIHNSIDDEFLNLLALSNQLPTRGKYILWVGRLEPIKGVDLLVRAFAKLQTTEISLVLLGDGTLRNYLEELAFSLGIKAMFLGFVDGLEKTNWYVNASVICVGTSYPELSQTLLEALATEKPVIACYDSEVESLFKDQLYMLRERSVDELATILDRAARRAKSYNNRNIIEKNFSSSTFSLSYYDFYLSIMQSCKK